MRAKADPVAFCEAMDAYHEAIATHDYLAARVFAEDAIRYCPSREELPLWQERQRDAAHRSQAPVKRFLSAFSLRRSS